MRPYFRVLLALLTISSALLPQKPVPICGLPHISQISPDAPVSLYKAVGVLTGDRRFKIRKDVPSTSAEFIEVDFYLKHSDTYFEVYVEVAEWDSGHVDSIAVDTLVTYFRDRTFPNSISPDEGIKAIAEDVFGPPPDIDNNGKVYILLTNVRDDYDPDSSDSYVAGYFDPEDQGGNGNNADIIYLDTNPGNVDTIGSDIVYFRLLNTTAHEYQHLLHYRQDKWEELWVNEGLSELSPVLMGLSHRLLFYYLENTNVQLDSFEGEIADYVRCGLFFLYTWKQFETSFIQHFVSLAADGITAFESALSTFDKPSFNDHVYNWHLANFLQERQGVYGYRDFGPLPQTRMQEAITRFPVEEVGRSVAKLGAQWTVVTGGEDINISATRTGAEPRLTLINGSTGAVIPAPNLFYEGFRDPTFGIDYTYLVVLATAFSRSAHHALYLDAEGNYSEDTLSYDGNVDLSDVTFYSLSDVDTPGEAAVAFDIDHDEGKLAAMQFMAHNNDSVRVRIYRGALSPEKMVYEGTIRGAPMSLAWTTFRLPEYIIVGGEQIYASIVTTTNALAYNENITVSHSYYRPPNGSDFKPLDDAASLNGNWSIRLFYLVPDTSEDEKDIPLAVGYFYPNPFIIERSARSVVKLEIISPGKPAEVRLYNILGQEIWKHSRPADVFSPIVWHGLMKNGRLAPSGVYLARIAVSDAVVCRKLVLIR
ncbi:MAG: hypothetical protein GH143_08720 [Calditrichaeota bacterium]|nr:hypothetical protein [Calditrichota bacterium]